jgi:hypothetical protein
MHFYSGSPMHFRFGVDTTYADLNAACCSAVFTGTKRIVGRHIASQSASASAASFLPA